MASDTAFTPGCDVLLLEDDAVFRRRLAGQLRALGAEVTECGRLDEARRLLGSVRFEYALVDLHLPDGEVLELFRAGAFSENTAVVVMTAFGGLKEAVEAMRLGACDYLAKPFEFEQVPLAFLRGRRSRTAARREEHQERGSDPDADEVFFGEPLRNQVETMLAAERRLDRPPPVLIEGETGTGKSRLARWMHAHGPRARQPFIPINCAALPENLAEDELFGHERGAFTDAKQGRLGLFEAADGGTLFLDEVGVLAAGTQAKLLTAVEDGLIRRLGGTREIKIDVRIMAASNQPLAGLVQAGKFRDDLYHRLHLLQITLPPLRDRSGEIVPLARHLLRRLTARHRLGPLEFSAAAEAALRAHAWPGNIRELAHEIERALIFSSGPTLDLATLGPATDVTPPDPAWRNPAWRLPENGFSIDGVIDTLVAEALRETGNNVSAAARRLGVSREFLRYRLASVRRPESGPQ
jgi:DNA-binding NtrC family response regulator